VLFLIYVITFMGQHFRSVNCPSISRLHLAFKHEIHYSIMIRVFVCINKEQKSVV